MFFSILIAIVGVFSLLLFVEIKRDQQKHGNISFCEAQLSSEFRWLEVTSMSDEQVQETLSLLMGIYGISHEHVFAPTVERSGNIVRLKIDPKLRLGDFASWVYNFMYGHTQGEVYQVCGYYPIETAEFDGKKMRNTALIFYTPKILAYDDVSNVFFRTKYNTPGILDNRIGCRKKNF